MADPEIDHDAIDTVQCNKSVTFLKSYLDKMVDSGNLSQVEKACYSEKLVFPTNLMFASHV